jgi:acyl-coenzyme A thioesterase PaaI-like protein
MVDVMRGIRDRKLPPVPMTCLIDFHCVAMKPGEIVMERQPDRSLENASGTLHRAVAAPMLETAMSAAAGTYLPANKGAVTLDLKITYLEPLTIESGPIRATGGSSILFAEPHTPRARSTID